LSRKEAWVSFIGDPDLEKLFKRWLGKKMMEKTGKGVHLLSGRA